MECIEINLEFCEEDHNKKEVVECLKKAMLPETTGIDCAYLLKTLGDRNRLTILHLLTIQEELCVGEFSELLDISQPLTSHQLRILKQMDLITSEKKGKSVFYRLREMKMKPLIETIINLSQL